MAILYNKGMSGELDPHPPIDEAAPDFTLPDQDGDIHSLSDYRGSWVLLYFYPKDDSAGCTKEACSLRDAFSLFGKLGAVVLGVSVDSPESHKKFAEKHKLPFTLLADIHKRVVNLYGVWAKKEYLGREHDGTIRASFLINPMGIIEKVYKNVKPEKHAEEVLEDLQKLETE